MVVPNEHHALEAIVSVLGVLEHQWNKCLHLKDLRRLLHNHVVVLEPKLYL